MVEPVTDTTTVAYHANMVGENLYADGDRLYLRDRHGAGYEYDADAVVAATRAIERGSEEVVLDEFAIRDNADEDGGIVVILDGNVRYTDAHVLRELVQEAEGL